MKKIDKQTFWAGMVGIIAFIAIICELIFGGISTASVSAAIKDLMGIAIDVMVFIVAVKLATKNNSTDPLETKLENALDKWRMDHANMITRDEEYDRKNTAFSFFMRTDLKCFFGDATASKMLGLFVKIPPIGSPKYLQQTFEMEFRLNVSTFLEGKNVENRKSAFEAITNDIAMYLQAKCNVTVDKIQPTKDGATMIVIANGLIADEENNNTIDDQIQNLISIIDTVYTCYLVAGNFKVK